MWLLCILSAQAADIQGTYALSSTPAEVEASIDAGIEASIRDLPPLFHGKARSRLAKVAEVCEHYTFGLDEQALTWTCRGKEPLVFDRASFGKTVRVQLGGKQVSANVALEGDTVRARFDGDNGQRTVTFAFVDDTLRVRSSVESAQLSVPVRWEATYTREAPPAP